MILYYILGMVFTFTFMPVLIAAIDNKTAGALLEHNGWSRETTGLSILCALLWPTVLIFLIGFAVFKLVHSFTNKLYISVRK